MGDTHPMKLIRLKLTHDLARACGLLEGERASVIEAEPVDADLVRRVHSPQYLNVLQSVNDGSVSFEASRFGLGTSDCPIIAGVWDYSLLSAGASVQCAEAVSKGEAHAAFNIAGGLHHAMPNRASGFCYLNDPAIAIRYLLERGYRVAYVDIDAHHGDGVQQIFYDSDRVLTISLHESGQFLFPGTGFEQEIGSGAGEGYSVNVPLFPYTDDEVFCWAFDQIVPTFIEAFQPDYLVTQLGCDSFRDDPLTHLALTTNGFCYAVNSLKKLARGRWIALGGGGYRVSNVARAWTLAWGIMSGQEVPEEIPVEFLAELEQSGVMKLFPEFHHLRKMHDPVYTATETQQCRTHAERVVGFLLDKVLPKVKSTSTVPPP